MFKYPESICWVDGVFLRPHHFQQSQREQALARASDRSLALSYAWGVKQLTLDEAALEQFCFSAETLQLILPGGVEVDLPGNATAEALDLSTVINEGARNITIYVGIAPLREGEPNMTDTATGAEPRRYTPIHREHFDINAGGNERPVMHRNLRLLFSTEADALPGYEKMPLIRFEVRRDSDGRPSLLTERNFIAPALSIDGAPELVRRLGALFIHLEKIGMNLISSLRNQSMKTPEKQHIRLERIMKAGTVQSALCVMKHLCSSSSATPFAIYGELCRLYMQLAAFRPLEDYPAPASYNHADSMPQFSDIIDAIYRLTSSEVAEWCVRVELTPHADLEALVGQLNEDWIPSIRAIYVGVDYRNQPRRIADMVEAGDAFKLTAASMATSRVRGVRLTEERYPSPLLPGDASRLWFQVERPDTDDTWQDILSEKRCAIAWSKQTMPDVQAGLYLILCNPDIEQ